MRGLSARWTSFRAGVSQPPGRCQQSRCCSHNRRPQRLWHLYAAGLLILFGLFQPLCAAESTPAPRPNILWLTSEDHGPHVGCYGDRFATTPNIDALAAKGLRYRRAWSCAPVCAPARTTLISGLYPTSTGAEHMRSLVPYPAGKQMFPQLLRDAGYYCTNNAKEDYNLQAPGQVWEASSAKAHWRNRAAAQPFFAVFNSNKSHESQLRKRPHTAVHDPSQVRVPAYHPDTPEVRQDWAQYYDVVSEADADAGKRLRELADAGLAEETIVFYFSDHGSGMPRNKRWPYHSGLQVPLVVYIPEKFSALRPPEYRAGGESERLVSFVDFAPTVLSLAGIRPPEWMQGHAFLGQFPAPPQPFVHGFRGRMDERYDLVRSVTDGRYVYLRNYMPHRIYGQHLDYMFQTPTTRVWKSLHDAGKLNRARDAFWNPKPAEELYDLQSDPDEVHNLIGFGNHQEIHAKLRRAQQEHAAAIRDIGLVPEGELFRRCGNRAPYDFAHDDAAYSVARLLAAAEAASLGGTEAIRVLKQAILDSESAVRYWGATSSLMRGQETFDALHADLVRLLQDPTPEVRVVAAESLAHRGTPEERSQALQTLLKFASPVDNDVFATMSALNSLDALGERAMPIAHAIRGLKGEGKVPDQRYANYVPRLLEELQRRSK